MTWKTIDDSKIRHVWVNGNGIEVMVDPSSYACCGVPMDEDTGDDLEYVRTEILENDATDICDCGHVLGVEDYDGGRCTACGTMLCPK